MGMLRDGRSCKSTLNPLPGLGFSTHGTILFVKEAIFALPTCTRLNNIRLLKFSFFRTRREKGDGHAG